MRTNEKLGLPFDKMKKVVIAFDVDGTLISNQERQDGEPFILANERIRTLLITLSSFKNTKIVVWSGSGELWCKQVINEIGIAKYVDKFMAKNTELKPDIVIDDIQDTALGKFNLIVREK